jgi:integrase
MSTGIRVRHGRKCATQVDRDAKCSCKPAYRAEVYDQRSKTKLRKTFRNLSEAKSWRHDAASALRKGTMRAPTRTTLREAAESWLEGAKSGAIRTRSGEPYKPSALRGYEQALRDRIYPELETRRISDVQRRDVQRIADEMLADGVSASTIRNTVNALRVVYRRALEDGDVAISPTQNLRLPAVVGTRDRIATPSEAAELIAALSERDRPLWATAFYGGLRRGELRALRWEDVDLAAGVIHVSRGWDDKEGPVAPKSRKGARKVPIAAVLRDFLDEHKLRTDRAGADFVFGSTAHRPFTPSAVRRRALTAWKTANARRAEEEMPLLEPIGLHECRHTYVSIMHDAGLSLERIGDYVGHSSTYMTDRYRHLLKGHEAEAAAVLDAYLERANTHARIVQVGSSE